jgi:hypothetical protein
MVQDALKLDWKRNRRVSGVPVDRPRAPRAVSRVEDSRVREVRGLGETAAAVVAGHVRRVRGQGVGSVLELPGRWNGPVSEV